MSVSLCSKFKIKKHRIDSALIIVLEFKYTRGDISFIIKITQIIKDKKICF